MFSRLKLMMLCAISVAAFSLFASTGSAAAGAIEGEVVKAGTSTGIKGVEACAFKLPEFEPVFCEETNTAGEYEISALPSGEYIVEFWASSLGYAPQFYNGVSSYEEAEEITVGGGTVSGIDAELQKGGAIEGRVTDASTGAGINEAVVCAFSRVIAGNCGLTNGAGNYAVIGLASGSYGVEFAGPLGYPTLFYNQQANPATANLVGVTAPGITGGINAQLNKPGSKVVVIPPPTPPTVTPAPPKHKAKALKCHKGYKKIRRHGRQVCVKKHKKKHHS